MAYRMWNTVKDKPAIEIGSGVLTYWCEPFGGRYVARFFVFYFGMAFFAMAIPKEERPLPASLAAFEFPPSLITPTSTSHASESVLG
jgi:hypothetical protein